METCLEYITRTYILLFANSKTWIHCSLGILNNSYVKDQYVGFSIYKTYWLVDTYCWDAFASVSIMINWSYVYSEINNS